MIIFKYIKWILIFTLVVHLLHDTWVINTMEARMTARLDSMQYLLARVAKQSGVSQAAALPEQVDSDMASANKLAPNDLVVPHWPVKGEK
jgi:hypothetical protein